MSFEVYSPNKIFVNKKDGTCKTKYVTRTIGAGTGTSVVSAVAGKKILVVGLIAFTATGTFNFTDGNGGAAIMYGPVSGAVVTPALILPFDEAGYFETSVNTALCVDVATAVVNFLIKYIEYTP